MSKILSKMLLEFERHFVEVILDSNMTDKVLEYCLKNNVTEEGVIKILMQDIIAEIIAKGDMTINSATLMNEVEKLVSSLEKAKPLNENSGLSNVVPSTTFQRASVRSMRQLFESR